MNLYPVFLPFPPLVFMFSFIQTLVYRKPWKFGVIKRVDKSRIATVKADVSSFSPSLAPRQRNLT